MKVTLKNNSGLENSNNIDNEYHNIDIDNGFIVYDISSTDEVTDNMRVNKISFNTKVFRDISALYNSYKILSRTFAPIWFYVSSKTRYQGVNPLTLSKVLNYLKLKPLIDTRIPYILDIKYETSVIDKEALEPVLSKIDTFLKYLDDDFKQILKVALFIYEKEFDFSFKVTASNIDLVGGVIDLKNLEEQINQEAIYKKSKIENKKDLEFIATCNYWYDKIKFITGDQKLSSLFIDNLYESFQLIPAPTFVKFTIPVYYDYLKLLFSKGNFNN